MKKCTRCMMQKELSDFHSDKYSKDGKRYWCKQCERERPKAPLKRQDITCPICLENRSVTYYSAKRRKTDYCSKCASNALLSGKKRPEHTGKNSKRWKGGSYISSGGYKMVRCDGKYLPSGRQRYRPEHVIIMEEFLKREVKTEQNGGGESIHHIDGNKLNNKIENLILCESSKDHRLLHASLEEIAFELVRDGIIKFDKEKRKYYRGNE